MIDASNDELIVDIMKALAHPLRYRIVRYLNDGEQNVGELKTATGIGQPALSQQLGVLRQANVVVTRRDGKLVYYSLSAETCDAVRKAIGTLGSLPSTSGQPIRLARPNVANFARLSTPRSVSSR